ncbi:uncharacterized protein EKO05_0010622 [Ascochyta rabiei]|uniref:uncharacterized protein n=1 Tax=Didymella rabiei TaxID=5454 RepID=UPI00220BA777|nr:uncharacterized protein EKO05_0010622 [Ascochyta rabiei]UPX20390.1 hypothetical protein EKO05_0010622 [Ascochyta rabiei]
MGICSSCLGGRSDEDPSDASQLLGDGYQPQYGTLDARPQHAPLPDPEEIRREREALEQICADTSSSSPSCNPLPSPMQTSRTSQRPPTMPSTSANASPRCAA